MRFARNFKGFLVDAETNIIHGDFICPLCDNLAHWRKESVDQRRPHFYHAIANDECPLSLMGGKWNVLKNENVEFYSDSQNEIIVFQKKVEPNFRKIPHIAFDEYHIDFESPKSMMQLVLTSSDMAQLDHTLSVFFDIITKHGKASFCAIPLPAKISSNRLKISEEKRTHRRLIKIIGSDSKLIEQFSYLSLPETVSIEFKTQH